MVTAWTPQPHFQLTATRLLHSRSFLPPGRFPLDHVFRPPIICAFTQLGLEAMASNAMEIENDVVAVEVLFQIHDCFNLKYYTIVSTPFLLSL